jgi:lathosterol oxidase
VHSVFYWIGWDALQSLIRYVEIASVVYGLAITLTLVLRRDRLQPSVVRSWRQLPREWTFSLVTLVIFSIILEIDLAIRIIRFEPDRAMSIFRQGTIVVVLIVLHDSWFYWTHRLMHTRLIWPIHRLHHLSVAPTVWSAYSFHPAEAMISGLFITAISPLLPPLSFGVTSGFMLFMLARNAIGHCGREVFPAGADGQPLISWSTTVTHHDMHHQWGKGNYGLYFTFWDRVMHTEHPAYLEQFRYAVTAKGKAGVRLSRATV